MRIIFPLTVSILIAHCSYSIQKPGVANHVMYTTADVLNVRSQPEITAPRIFQIPFGTAVATSKTKSATWLYRPDLNGYGSAEFFQDSIPENQKNFTLRSRSEACLCASEGFSAEDTLILSKGKAYWSSIAYLAYAKEETSAVGDYSLSGQALSIQIPKHISKSCDVNVGPTSCSKQEKAALSFRLIWNEDARGFLADYNRKRVSDPAHKLNTEKCIIVPTFAAPFSDCNSYCDGKVKGQFEIGGYYCAR